MACRTFARTFLLRCFSFSFAVSSGGLLALLCLSTPAFCQTDPSNFDTVINVPPDPAPATIASSTQLNLSDGGFLAGLEIGEDGTHSNMEVNISGGFVDGTLIARGESTINISGGVIEGFILTGGTGSQFHVSGGELRSDRTRVSPGGYMAMSGGVVNSHDEISVYADGVFDLSGGLLVGDLLIRGTMNITGGAFETSPRIFDTGQVEIFGGEFLLNGLPYNDPTITLAQGDVLTGTLSSGDVLFMVATGDGLIDEFKLTPTPLPPKQLATIVVDATNPIGPQGLREGESLVLRDGGMLGHHFTAVGATVDIEGGTTENIRIFDSDVSISSDAAELLAYGDSKINLSAGTIDRLNLSAGSQLTMTGGTAFLSVVGDGEVVTISGGVVKTGFAIQGTSQASVSGGHFESTGIRSGSSFNSVNRTPISGGTFADRISYQNVELLGNDFRLNGVEYTADTLPTLGPSDYFSGILADGSVLLLAYDSGDRVSDMVITRVDIPQRTTDPIVVDTANPISPAGIRDGQRLTLRDGGTIEGGFTAIDSTVEIEGGIAKFGLEALRSNINMSGGQIDGVLDLHSGSTLSIDGGQLQLLSFLPGSELIVSGGSIENAFSLTAGSVAEFHGGGEDILNKIQAHTGSEVHLFGTEFYLGGVPFDELSVGQPLEVLTRGQILSGVLADGTSFSFELHSRSSNHVPYVSSGALVTINRVQVPEPTTAVLTVFACCSLMVIRKKPVRLFR